VPGSTFDELIANGEEFWNQGYELVDVEYGDGIWLGTVEKATAVPNISDNTIFDQFIQINQVFAEHQLLFDVASMPLG
jgi:hypothetical protein